MFELENSRTKNIDTGVVRRQLPPDPAVAYSEMGGYKMADEEKSDVETTGAALWWPK
jgi:hypothetical protein